MTVKPLLSHRLDAKRYIKPPHFIYYAMVNRSPAMGFRARNIQDVYPTMEDYARRAGTWSNHGFVAQLFAELAGYGTDPRRLCN